MKKKELIGEVSRRTGLDRYAVDEVYGATCELIAEKLIHKEDIELPGIGTFVLAEKNAKGLLYGEQKNMEKKCIYPLFRINERLKKRVKNMTEYRKRA